MCFGSIREQDETSETAPASAAPVNPDSSVARLDRLVAAQEDTGYSLEQRVIITGCFGTELGSGKVVGFGRVNAPKLGESDVEPKRFVLVYLDRTATANGGSLRVNIAAIDPKHLKAE